jgi:hypothetical protein
VLLVLTPLASLSLVEREHGRTIPLADFGQRTRPEDYGLGSNDSGAVG